MLHRPKSAATVLVLLLLSSSQLRGGGLLYVGGSAFDPAARGKGLGWANGQLTYFTDLGDLSPLLDQAAANSFVDDAVQTWASVPTAALTITRGGALAEDQAIVLRVTDSASPSNYAAGVPVAISELVLASLGPPDCSPVDGVCNPAAPKIISNSLTTLVSDADGIISFAPAVQTAWGAVQISLHAAASATATLDASLRVLPQ